MNLLGLLSSILGESTLPSSHQAIIDADICDIDAVISTFLTCEVTPNETKSTKSCGNKSCLNTNDTNNTNNTNKPAYLHELTSAGESIIMSVIRRDTSDAAVPKVNALLRAGASVFVVDNGGQTAMHYAAAASAELCKLIDETYYEESRGMHDIRTTKDKNDVTPLHFAIHSNCMRNCMYILMHYSKENLLAIADITGDNIMMSAVESRKYKMIKFIAAELKKKEIDVAAMLNFANPNTRRTAILTAIKLKCKVKILDLLVELGAEFKDCDKIVSFAFDANAKTLKWVLEHGAVKINVSDKKTALLLDAVYNKSVDAIKCAAAEHKAYVSGLESAVKTKTEALERAEKRIEEFNTTISLLSGDFTAAQSRSYNDGHLAGYTKGIKQATTTDIRYNRSEWEAKKLADSIYNTNNTNDKSI